MNKESPEIFVKDEDAAAQRICICQYWTAICRAYGLIMLSGLLGTTIVSYQLRPWAAITWYLQCCMMVIVILEVHWILRKVCDIAYGSIAEHCCSYLALVDTWRKTLVYFAFSIPLLLQGPHVIPSFVAGVLLDVGALLYLAKILRHRRIAQKTVQPGCETLDETQKQCLISEEASEAPLWGASSDSLSPRRATVTNGSCSRSQQAAEQGCSRPQTPLALHQLRINQPPTPVPSIAVLDDPHSFHASTVTVLPKRPSAFAVTEELMFRSLQEPESD